MNKFKWIFLIIIIVVSIMIITNIKKDTIFNSYLVLGDSIAEGHSLNNKNDKYSKLIQSNYKIKNENYIDLSKSGMTAKELASNIKNEEYINAIKNSDLITISIGSNELLGVLTELLQEAIILNGNKNSSELSNALMQKLQSPEAQKSYDNAIKVYEQSWDKIISSIKSINPTATIVVTEFYNPLYSIENLSNLSNSYIEKMNNILYEKSNNETSYLIAKIYDDFNDLNNKYTHMSVDIENLKTSSFDPHPNSDGHKLIEKKIEEVLSNHKI